MNVVLSLKFSFSFGSFLFDEGGLNFALSIDMTVPISVPFTSCYTGLAIDNIWSSKLLIGDKFHKEPEIQ